METVEIVSLMLGSAWASGINLYAAVLVLGWLGGSGQIDLPPDLAILTHPLVMSAAGGMYVLEFFADKIPGVDSLWDTLHTFIRIPAGAMLAAGAAQGLEMGQAVELAALLLGGGVSAATHATKAGSRVLINTSPEPVSNWTASVAEDLSVIGGLWAALNHPWLFIVLFALFVLLIAWLLPRIWRALRRGLHAVRHWFAKPAGNPGSGIPATPTSRRREVLDDLYQHRPNGASGDGQEG